jgi:hypothetical protein
VINFSDLAPTASYVTDAQIVITDPFIFAYISFPPEECQVGPSYCEIDSQAGVAGVGFQGFGYGLTTKSNSSSAELIGTANFLFRQVAAGVYDIQLYAGTNFGANDYKINPPLDYTVTARLESSNPGGIALAPEPGAWTLCGVGLLVGIVGRRRWAIG